MLLQIFLTGAFFFKLSKLGSPFLSFPRGEAESGNLFCHPREGEAGNGDLFCHSRKSLPPRKRGAGTELVIESPLSYFRFFPILFSAESLGLRHKAQVKF